MIVRSRADHGAGSLGLGLCLVMVSCVGSDSPVLPESAAPVRTAMPHSRVPASAPATVGPKATVTATGDLVATAGCGEIRVAADRPQRLQDARCGEEYLVNLTVEGDSSQTPLLDMFRSYDMADWRVQTTAGRVRHDLSLVWRPYRDVHRRDKRDEIVVWNPGSVTTPLTVRLCPDGDAGGASILACSSVACELYEREDRIPSVFLPSQDVVLEAPWRHEEIQDLREGSTLQIPVRYFVRDRAADLDIDTGPIPSLFQGDHDNPERAGRRQGEAVGRGQLRDSGRDRLNRSGAEYRAIPY